MQLSDKRFENIELLRVLAVMAVFVGHVAQKLQITGHIRALTDMGRLGVELFFCISGFLAIKHFDSAQNRGG